MAHMTDVLKKPVLTEKSLALQTEENEGKTNKRRKAIVKLAEGNSINYFDED